ncbi:MAG TPA: YbhB/YbcL family Raf kinase inhibitor-like protein [Methylomirabilota bacterium]|jgi:Raf kinase inhibitor-like YbhB/YbcL family protein|nr:YbhB/YbcL family Raf kinase inhibitor-like protein [Methylomirabilota bacterium]
MKITSPVFKDGEKIPKEYTREGQDKSPPLHLEEVPERAKSLAVIVEDPDAPKGTFIHWLVFNIDPRTRDIREGGAPVMSTQGSNDWGEVQYGGPRPPSGEHRYFFKAVALDAFLPLARGASREALEQAMRGHVVEEAALMGRYARQA